MVRSRRTYDWSGQKSLDRASGSCLGGMNTGRADARTHYIHVDVWRLAHILDILLCCYSRDEYQGLGVWKLGSGQLYRDQA